MAGRKLIITTQVRASTILEVLISMTVIMVVFGIAMMIFANITRSSLSTQKLTAEKILNDLLINDEKSTSVVNQSITVGDLKVEQVVQPYDSYSGLMTVDLTAFDAAQQKIAEIKKIILTNNE